MTYHVDTSAWENKLWNAMEAQWAEADDREALENEIVEEWERGEIGETALYAAFEAYPDQELMDALLTWFQTEEGRDPRYNELPEVMQSEILDWLRDNYLETEADARERKAEEDEYYSFGD